MISRNQFEIFKIVLLYAVFGCIWIYFSDSIVHWFVVDPDVLTEVAIFKGIFFIFCTSLLLYILIYRFNRKIHKSSIALNRSESHLEALVQTIPDLIWLKDENGVYLSCNLQFEKYFGVDQSKIIGKTDYDFVDKNLADFFREHDHKAMEAGGPSTNEEWITYANNGGQVLLETIKTPMFTREGKLIGILGIGRDITDRKQMEDQLRENEQRLRAVFDSVEGVPIQGYDKDRRVIYWNFASELLYGYSHDEAIGRAFEELIIPEESRQEVIEGVRQWHDQGVPIPSGEIELLNKSGERLQVYSNHVMILNHWGEKEMFCIDVDLTERKRVEEVMRESEKRFATAFHYSPAPLVLSEVDTGLFIDVNDRWIEMLEFTREEQIGRTSKEVGIWDDPEERDRIVAKLRSDGRFKDEPIRFKTKSGKIIIALWSAESVNLSGQQVMLSMITDITQLKLAEEERECLSSQLQQAQKLESVGRLAGGIAHDFNNMLGVILGYTELALEKVDPASPLYGNLHRIHQAGERSADLTRQLLAFARKQTIAPKVIDINDTVEGMLNMLRRLIGEDIDLLWHPGRNLQPVKIDPSQIDQLLVNLCINARDAIEKMGKITIETSVKSIDKDYCHDHLESQAGDYVMLEVSDDGCGMDQKILSHIFEPFFTTKGKGEGTGLGLASIYGIVKQNNGFINVYSEPDQGTTFKIYLPVCGTKSAEASEKAHDPPIEHGNETVLLVEDESAILEMTTTMLESLGYRVVAACNPWRGYPSGS